MEKRCKKLKSALEKYRKRNQRQKKKVLSTPSPRTKVKRILREGNAAVKKRLLFGESLISQLKERFRKCKGTSEKQMFVRSITGNVLKKYRVMRYAKSFLSGHCNRKNTKFGVKRRRSSAVSDKTKTVIQQFLEDDENSIMAPGKKECITRQKVQKQRRYLLGTLKTLHEKFLKSGDMKMSYSTFCKFKPFWIVERKITNRETCMCVKHANFQHLLDRLNYHGVVTFKDPDQLSNLICCDSGRKECMFR